jgi:hypothetical protein
MTKIQWAFEVCKIVKVKHKKLQLTGESLMTMISRDKRDNCGKNEKVKKPPAVEKKPDSRPEFKATEKVILSPQQKQKEYRINHEKKEYYDCIKLELLKSMEENKKLKRGDPLKVSNLVLVQNANALMPKGFKLISYSTACTWCNRGYVDIQIHGSTKLAPELLESLASWVECKQECQQPVTPAEFKDHIRRAVEETGFNVEYIYGQVRLKHPHRVSYVTGDESDLRRAEWLTHSKALHWHKGWCKFLVDKGFAVYKDWTDKDGNIFVIEVHEWAKDRIMNGDETQLKMTNEYEKGGSRSLLLGCISKPPPKTNSLTAPSHTTLMQCVTLAENVLPLHVIVACGTAETASVDLLGFEGLPKVENAAGDHIDNLISATPKGSMDTTRFGHFNEMVVRYYGDTLADKWEFGVDAAGKKFVVKGPVVLQVDSGPGRFADCEENLHIRRWTREKGLYLYAGLPNGTAAMQLMDQLFTYLDMILRKNAQSLVLWKLKERFDARVKGDVEIPLVSLSRKDIGKLLTGVSADAWEGQCAFSDAFTRARIIAAGTKTGLDGCCSAFLKHERMLDDTQRSVTLGGLLINKHNASLTNAGLVAYSVEHLKLDVPPPPPNFIIPNRSDLLLGEMVLLGAFKASTVYRFMPNMSINDGEIMVIHTAIRRKAVEDEAAKAKSNAETAAKHEEVARALFHKYRRLPRADAEKKYLGDELLSLIRFIFSKDPYTKHIQSNYGTKPLRAKFLSEIQWRQIFEANFDEVAVSAEHVLPAAVAVPADLVDAAPAPIDLVGALVPIDLVGAVPAAPVPVAPAQVAAIGAVPILAVPALAAPVPVAPAQVAAIGAVPIVAVPVRAVGVRAPRPFVARRIDLVGAVPAAPVPVAPVQVAAIGAVPTIGAVPILAVPIVAVPIVAVPVRAVGVRAPRPLVARKRPAAELPAGLSVYEEEKRAKYANSGSRLRRGRGGV